MIRSQQDALLELQVVEREIRFIHGMRWHLEALLGRLEWEEQMLLPTLPLEETSGSNQEQSTSVMIDDDADAAPGTPKTHTLLGLDPLGIDTFTHAVELHQETPLSSSSASEQEWVGAAPPKRRKLETSNDLDTMHPNTREQHHSFVSSIAFCSEEDRCHPSACNSSSEEHEDRQCELQVTSR
eukprot:CAMPEP_0172717348 /NCGR_PEP_ID=MMETSP1074-20121228/71145_1 /TAXON_ID=2916 /ORGANISM="Ceratium fusus, Strain PA161109" /LENGTH=182 /DNA_ID=CAMNT_0013542267 /DNA_START=106 /DNA_END=651 /DNA_ORIENTATION=+